MADKVKHVLHQSGSILLLGKSATETKTHIACAKSFMIQAHEILLQETVKTFDHA
jgi:hypothetical protein